MRNNPQSMGWCFAISANNPDGDTLLECYANNPQGESRAEAMTNNPDRWWELEAHEVIP